jgi:hypothetical protein
MLVIGANTFEFSFVEDSSGKINRQLTLVVNGIKYCFALNNPKQLFDGVNFSFSKKHPKLCYVPDSSGRLIEIKDIGTLLKRGKFYLMLDSNIIPVDLMYSCTYEDGVSSEFGVFTNVDIQLAIES